MTSKGKQEMGKTVITRQLQIGDKFKIPGNPSQTYEVVDIKGDYLIYRNIRSHEEFQMVRGFASKVDLVEESAIYQKKRFKEPYYMYNESAKTIKEAQERKRDYLAIVKRFRQDINKHIDKVERDIERGFAIDYSDRDEAQVLGTRFSAELLRYNLAVENKVLTEGFMVKEKSGNTYIGRFDSKDKAEKAVKDLAKRRGQSEADWLVEPDDKYMAAATAKGSSSWGPIPMNTLVEDYGLITDVKVGNTIIYHGKELKVIQKTPDIVIAMDDKGNATKFSITHFNEPIMIKEANKIEEGFIISDTSTNNKPVYFRYGKYTGYDWGFDKNAATKFSTKEAAERMIEKMRQEGMLIKDMKIVQESKTADNLKVMDKVWYSESGNGDDIEKIGIQGTILNRSANTIKVGNQKMHGKDIPHNMAEYRISDKHWWKIDEGRIAKGYENLDADEKARHLLSHPSSKYMNDLKSENITERAIRKAVKEMLGKPDKRDPQFIIDVNEEGEAPAIANTTAEVANPDLPLKLKEDLESDKAEALADYKKAKAEYLANKSDENWKKFSNAKSKCMQLGCRI